VCQSASVQRGVVLSQRSRLTSILGPAVVAKGKDQPAEASCTYFPASGIGPYIELKVDWGDDKPVCSALGSRAEPIPALPIPWLVLEIKR